MSIAWLLPVRYTVKPLVVRTPVPTMLETTMKTAVARPKKGGAVGSAGDPIPATGSSGAAFIPLAAVGPPAAPVRRRSRRPGSHRR